MKKINFLLLIFVFIFSYSFTSCKGDKGSYTFQLNFKEGDKFTQILTNEMDVLQQVMGQQVKVPTRTDIRIRYAVDKVTDSGYVFTAVRENIKIKTGTGIVSMTIDSDKNDMFGMGPIFKAMTGKPIQVTTDRYGKVLSTQGEEEIAKALAEAVEMYIPAQNRESVITGIEDQYRSVDIKSAWEQLFFYIPDHEVSVGDKWNKRTDLNNHYYVANDIDVSFKSVQGNTAELEVSGVISTGSPQKAEVEGYDMEFNMEGTQKGTVKVNTVSGLASRIEMQLDINAVANTGGNNLSQNMKTKVTIVTE